MKILQEQPWFVSWFNSNYYHQLYRHRDNHEAEKFIDSLLDVLEPAAGATMVDLGCGEGRHSKYLASKGYTVFGLDLAAASIRKAKQFETGSLQFLNWDMRQPFGKNNFDFVLSFFTSFGYFTSEEENNKVIRNMASAVKKDGTVVIDYLNTTYAEEHLVSVEEKEIDGVWYHINRWADDRFIYKHISIQDGQQFTSLAYTEQVAKFSLEDFTDFFKNNGLKLNAVYGDYEMKEFDEQSSKRMILMAKKI